LLKLQQNYDQAKEKHEELKQKKATYLAKYDEISENELIKIQYAVYTASETEKMQRVGLINISRKKAIQSKVLLIAR
jgi:hypothetical protein